MGGREGVMCVTAGHVVLDRLWTLSSAWRSHLLPAWRRGRAEGWGGRRNQTCRSRFRLTPGKGGEDSLGISMETALAVLCS